MIYLTQLIYVREGHEATFNQFEDTVLPLQGAAPAKRRARRGTQSFAVLDHEIGDGLVAADLARGFRQAQPPPAPRDHAGFFQSLNAFAQRLKFSGADSFLAHDVCTLSDTRQSRAAFSC